MSLALSILAFILAAMAWSSNKAIRANMNQLLVRLTICERARGLAPSHSWQAKIRRRGGKPVVQTFVASNESDATRQLLMQGVSPVDILSLDRVGGPDVPPAA